MIARFDPKKDHINFIKAAKIALNKNINFKFMFVTNHITPLKTLTQQEGLSKKFLFLPLQDSLEKIYNSLDINTLSSSFGEGFPNVLAEGISCGTISISTNVGDASLIINDDRLVVPPSDPNSLSDAWLWAYKLAESEKIEIINKSKDYINNNFSNTIMIGKMSSLYKSIFYSK
jgi:glycosyltransferase involved in cell wall biosynthesis